MSKERGGGGGVSEEANKGRPRPDDGGEGERVRPAQESECCGLGLDLKEEFTEYITQKQ